MLNQTVNVLNKAGLTWFVPMVRLAAGDDPREQLPTEPLRVSAEQARNSSGGSRAVRAGWPICGEPAVSRIARATPQGRSSCFVTRLNRRLRHAGSRRNTAWLTTPFIPGSACMRQASANWQRPNCDASRTSPG